MFGPVNRSLHHVVVVVVVVIIIYVTSYIYNIFIIIIHVTSYNIFYNNNSVCDIIIRVSLLYFIIILHIVMSLLISRDIIIILPIMKSL